MDMCADPGTTTSLHVQVMPVVTLGDLGGRMGGAWHCEWAVLLSHEHKGAHKPGS